MNDTNWLKAFYVIALMISATWVAFLIWAIWKGINIAAKAVA